MSEGRVAQNQDVISMTRAEALALIVFDEYCTCGGFAAGSLNNRNPEHPHMSWCPQRPQWEAWKAALAGDRD